MRAMDAEVVLGTDVATGSPVSLGLREDNKPGLMIDWIVGALAAEAKRQGVPKQFKPWPDPLPDQMPRLTAGSLAIIPYLSYKVSGEHDTPPPEGVQALLLVRCCLASAAWLQPCRPAPPGSGFRTP